MVQMVNKITTRQKILKALYPIWMWWTKMTGKNMHCSSVKNIDPPVSFYTLQSILNNGTGFDFHSLKGKKVLLVNTASDCGYTHQYSDLEKLHRQYRSSLTVIGFPANDFKEQEKADDASIAAFCQFNFGITFPLMKKSSVVKGSHQHAVFQWLTDAKKNGWNNQQPSWNFCKYMVDEQGKLTHFFEASIEPFSREITDAINK